MRDHEEYSSKWIKNISFKMFGLFLTKFSGGKDLSWSGGIDPEPKTETVANSGYALVNGGDVGTLTVTQ